MDNLFGIAENETRSGSVRPYGGVLTVDINQKGVLDVDTVKGCTAGTSAHGPKGCYQACYAATLAKSIGIDFNHAVARTVQSHAQALQIERAVRAAPLGFFRIGTMGDPCHAWEHTVKTVEWLAPFATPVIITKHWIVATDAQLQRLVKCGTVLNTSISGLDSNEHLSHRLAQIARYSEAGGTSVARVVSCDFNRDNPEGARMAAIQDRLFEMRPMIDNPLRCFMTHPLVVAGIIRVHKRKDLASERTISMAPDSKSYVGHCSGCSDLCGAGLLGKPDKRPLAPQTSMF
jgi:hypothetical protein